MPECINPFTLSEERGGDTVPCGKCEACRSRQVSSWSFRLMQEAKHSTNAHFITLTYDTKYVPITSHGFMSLCKRDVQLFFKRLRKKQSALVPSLYIRYYTVGEYGSKTQRPHYHAIIYNAEISLIQDAWKKGQVHYGTLSPASCGYTLKYVFKKGLIPAHRNDDRIPEFALMSKGLASVTLQPI